MGIEVGTAGWRRRKTRDGFRGKEWISEPKILREGAARELELHDGERGTDVELVHIFIRVVEARLILRPLGT